jgi:hypothetical protein
VIAIIATVTPTSDGSGAGTIATLLSPPGSPRAYAMLDVKVPPDSTRNTIPVVEFTPLITLA